uniref:Uncharacterized protein n=1 Tax=Glossina pallidipes TaxID=7398 RepID=A0A1A9Z895_GLOPL
MTADLLLPPTSFLFLRTTITINDSYDLNNYPIVDYHQSIPINAGQEIARWSPFSNPPNQVNVRQQMHHLPERHTMKCKTNLRIENESSAKEEKKTKKKRKHNNEQR